MRIEKLDERRTCPMTEQQQQEQEREQREQQQQQQQQKQPQSFFLLDDAVRTSIGRTIA
jgi:hypothetical protein